MSETITASLTVSGGDTITAEINTLARGPAGPAGEGGSGAITSATTSDGTANLSISNLSTATGSVSGILTAPTAATTTSTTQVATTAFVQQELASGVAVAKNLEFLARNQSGATITKGSIVYINGATGNKPLITLAQANSDENSAQTIGFAKTDITNNGTGFVIVRGELESVNTNGLGEGTQLYLSPSVAGNWTTTKPSAPEHLVYVGIVVRDHPTQGIILVAIQNGYELNEIHDVAISSPAAKQVIKRNAGNTLWVNESIISTDVSDSTATGRSLMTATTQSDARTTGLGSGATGDQLFTADTPAEARTSLGFDGMVPKVPFTISLESDFTTPSTSFVNVTGVSFPVEANKRYAVSYYILTNKNDTSGLAIQFTGPASPTKISLRQFVGTTSFANTVANIITAFSTASTTFNTFNGDSFATASTGIIDNGANAGTVQLQLRAVTGGTARIYAGSYLQVTEL